MPIVYRQKLSIHFGEDKTKSKLFSKTKCLKKTNISFADYSIKQDDAVKHLGCKLHSKLSGEAMTSIVLRKVNAKLKFLYRQSRYCDQKTVVQCANSATFRLWMFLMISTFKEKLPKTSKRSKQIYFFQLTSEISYRSIALQKNTVTSSEWQSRSLYCKYRF